MAGIKNIKDLYKKVGEKGLREVLEKDVRVTEKFDAYRFAFEKNPHNYKIYFYGKNGKTPLSKIDRTVNDLYEAAVAHIENLPADIKKAIPVRHRFGFSWFPSKQPLNTSYDRAPKGGLMLTDITVRNRQWEVTNEVHDMQVYDRWAKILKVEANHPIFEGKLDESTIVSLIELAKDDYTLASLNESQVYTTGKLNETNTNIEALVIESGDSLIKLADTIVEERKVEKRSHLFDILLLDICEHISSYNIAGLKPVSMHADESYIDVVSEIFNEFVDAKGKDFLASTLERPRFLDKSGKFNRSWIKNPKTLNLVESNSKYEYLFTVFLTNLRKPKYPSGLLGEATVAKFNSKIEEIDRVLSDDFSFLEFNSILREDELIEISEGIELTDTEKKAIKNPDYVKSVLIMQSFFDADRKPIHGKEPVNVIVCNVVCLTKDIIGEAERLLKLNGKRTMLMHDVFAEERSLRIDMSNIIKILDTCVFDHSDIFIGYKILKHPFLSDIYKKLGKDFTAETIAYAVGSKEYHNLEKKAIDATYPENSPKTNIIYFKSTRYKNYMTSLEKEMYNEFCECTPNCVQPFWPVIKSAFDRHTYH